MYLPVTQGAKRARRQGLKRERRAKKERRDEHKRERKGFFVALWGGGLNFSESALQGAIHGAKRKSGKKGHSTAPPI